MKSKKIQVRVIVLILLMGLASPGIAQNSKKWTPQEKIEIVFEGIRNPDQIEEICKRYDISESTFEAWKKALLDSSEWKASKKKLIDSAELICGSSEKAEITESEVPKSSVITLETDVVTSEQSKEEDSWKVHAGLKFWYARVAIHDRMGREPFNDYSTLGGVGIAFSKGKNIISLSLMGLLDEWEDEAITPTYVDYLRTAITYGDWYYADIRFHRMMNENVTAFLGYKVTYGTQEQDDYNHPTGNHLHHMPENRHIAHGPGFGLNSSFPIGETKFSLGGSIFIGPYMWVHHKERTIDFVQGTDTTKSWTDNGWFVNPEARLRYELTSSIDLSLGYRWDIMGTYDEGGFELVTGPTVGISGNF